MTRSQFTRTKKGSIKSFLSEPLDETTEKAKGSQGRNWGDKVTITKVLKDLENTALISC